MVACKGYAAGEGRGSNPLAFGIAIARSVSASTANSLMFGGTIFSLSSGYFSGKYALSRERCATSMAEWVLILRWRSLPMHKTNSIIMCAPRMTIFETAANLELWPRILPHYRYIRYLEHGPSRNVVVMAATRSGIPISWTSEQIIDRDRVGSSLLSHESIHERNARSLDISGSARRSAGRNQTRSRISREDFGTHRGQNYWRLFHSPHCK